MRFSYSLLMDLIETTASPREIADKLNSIGFEVESFEDNASIYKDFTVAKIVEVAEHPDADRLKVCKVETIDGEKQIVCGASNVKLDMWVVFAPIGSYVPGVDLLLKSCKIRGVESHGMMLSEKELKISDEHSGIIEISPDSQVDCKVGSPIIEVLALDDAFYTLTVTANRSDCYSVYGIARDLCGSGLAKLKKLPKLEEVEEIDSPIDITIEDSTDTSCFYGIFVKDVQNCPSSAEFQKKLIALGIKPISALVDISNYMTLMYGRPLHMFDSDKLRGNLCARRGLVGEKMITLSEKEVSIDDSMIVIHDNKSVVALAGIIGSLSAGCTMETRNIFIECAIFDAVHILRTGKKLGIITDAQQRFSRGLDPNMVEFGAAYGAQMVRQLCGGQSSEIVKRGSIATSLSTIDFDPSFYHSLTGIDMEKIEMENWLSNLGFVVDSSDASSWQIKCPSYRNDLDGEADIVEELLRMSGLDKIRSIPLARVAVEGAKVPKLHAIMTRAKSICAIRGMCEIVSWSFISSNLQQDFDCVVPELVIENPISKDMNHMRTTLVPGLLQSALFNIRYGFESVAVFEGGQVFKSSEPDGQAMVIAGLRYGYALSTSQETKIWRKESNRNADFYDVKQDVISIIASIGFDTNNLVFESYLDDQGQEKGYGKAMQSGQSAFIKIGNMVIGRCGMVNLDLLDFDQFCYPVHIFEINLNVLSPMINLDSYSAKMKPFVANNLPSINRDFSVVVDKEFCVGDLIKSVRKVNRKLIKDIVVFDVYTGDKLTEGKKAVAFTAIIEPDRSLGSKDLQDFVDKIILALNDCGGEVRS